MSNIDNRVDLLKQELDTSIAHYLGLARWNYRFAFLLVAIILITSFLASLGGFLKWQAITTGILAILPAAVAVSATALKPQDRANWHYRKTDGLNSLRRRLLFELPDPPTADNVAAIASDLTKLDSAMSIEWERNFSLNQSLFGSHDQMVPKDPS